MRPTFSHLSPGGAEPSFLIIVTSTRSRFLFNSLANAVNKSFIASFLFPQFSDNPENIDRIKFELLPKRADENHDNIAAAPPDSSWSIPLQYLFDSGFP